MYGHWLYYYQNQMSKYKFPQNFMSCTKILWDDGDHLSIFGEAVIGKRFPDRFLRY